MNNDKFICPECGEDLMGYFQPMLHYAGPENETFNVQLSSPMFKLFAKSIADVFDSSGAINFFAITMSHIPSNRDFEITIKRSDGKSPAELLTESKNEIDRLKAENDRMRSALKPFAEWENVLEDIEYFDDKRHWFTNAKKAVEE
jgi:hypothetical protein